MTTPFPVPKELPVSLHPSRVEADILDLEVEGAIPADLNGTLYRVGPDAAWPQRYDYFSEMMNGDGMASMFRIIDGHVDFKSRYVRTEKFKLERAARRALFGRYRNPYTDDPEAAGKDRGTANTHIIWHHGKLLALKEDTLPYELDPDTLETRGSYDFNGQLKARHYTAHPHIDPLTGELWGFGYELDGEASSDVALIVIDKDGRLIREDRFVAPYPALMHDFQVTRDYVIFPVFPSTADDARLKRGGAHFAWDPSQETFIGVMPRASTAADIRWFRGPATFSSHTLNAFNNGPKVHLDLFVGNKNYYPFMEDLAGNKLVLGPDDGPRLTRFTMDMAGNNDGFDAQRLLADHYQGEMPRIDDRFALSRYRYGFVPIVDMRGFEGNTRNVKRNHIARIDVETGEVRTHFLGATSTPQEPIFVPREGSRKEGDGYVLDVVNRQESGITELVILDAQEIERPSLARIKVPYVLKYAFHGSWVAESVNNAWPVRPRSEYRDWF
jgi:carotenoid cleavage dioxygenase-like enzyme